MNKTRLLIIAICLGACVSINAQTKGTLGFTFSAFNNNQMLRPAEISHDYTTVDGRGFMSFSADYWYPVNDWLDFETGVNYSLQNFRDIYNNPSLPNVAPLNPKDYNMHLVNIPMGIRAEFLKYGFVNGGILVDLMKEAGIGSYFGVGAKIESPIGFGMFINPYVKAHSIFPIDFNKEADRILETGVRVGIFFNLGKSVNNWR